MTFEIIEIREGKLGYKIALLQRPEGAPERYVVAKDYNPEKRIWHMGGIYFTTLYDAVRCFERQTTLKDEDDNYEDDSETQEKRDSDMARLDEIHLLECFYVGQQEVVNILLGEMECYKTEYCKMPARLQERLKQIDARVEDKLAELESKKNELLLKYIYVGQQEVVNMLLGEMECYKMEYYKMLVRLQERLKQIDARAEDKLAELESKKNELLGF